jgi:hypothetical protein
MPDETATVRVSEHAALRDEILQNKKLTFERPLLIVSAAAVAGAQLNTSYAVWFLPIGLLAFLWLNVSFTEDRMKSTARIGSYLGLFLEAHPQEWIGWENALRRYRLKFSTKDSVTVEKSESPASAQSSVFHSSLYLIHVLPVFLSLCALLVALCHTHQVLEILITIATASLAAPFFVGRVCT